MKTLTKKIDIDYKFGIIMFDCENINDIREIGEELMALGFTMRYSKIEDANDPNINEAMEK